MNEVYRQEKKFLISMSQYYSMSNRISHILKPDSYSSGDGYTIRSLYFDDIDDTDFEDKQNGIEVRRKIRLRNYGPDTPFALLEMKQRQGWVQKKRSLKISKEEARIMASGNYSSLLKHNDPFADECFALMNMRCYRPKAVLSYTRKVFVAKENRIRVTFDHHIKGTESNFDIFAADLPENMFLGYDVAVLEVKFNTFLLNHIREVLSECDRSEKAISKYCFSRTLSKHYLF